MPDLPLPLFPSQAENIEEIARLSNGRYAGWGREQESRAIFMDFTKNDSETHRVLGEDLDTVIHSALRSLRRPR